MMDIPSSGVRIPHKMAFQDTAAGFGNSMPKVALARPILVGGHRTNTNFSVRRSVCLREVTWQ